MTEPDFTHGSAIFHLVLLTATAALRHRLQVRTGVGVIGDASTQCLKLPASAVDGTVTLEPSSTPHEVVMRVKWT